MLIKTRSENIDEFKEKMQSMKHLYFASKNINYWTFSQELPPQGSPKSTHHVFKGRDKNTGIVQSWLVDETQAIDGHFEPEHQRIIYEFSQALIQLDDMIKAYKRAYEMGVKKQVLPDSPDLGMRAKSLLLKGDHSQSW